MADPTDKIPGSSNIQPSKSLPSSEEQATPSKSGGQSFESYMQPEQGSSAKPSGESQEVTPFDLAGKAQPIATPTMESVLAQVNSNSSLVGDLQNEFQNNKDKLKLKQSQKYLLRNKLKSANQKIRTSAQTAGVDPGAAPNWAAKKNPIEKFIGLLGDSQLQLSKTQTMISNLRDKNGMISPGNLLLIQTKLAKAQQELEYSSVLLSKAVDDIKQMFNIQI